MHAKWKSVLLWWSEVAIVGHQWAELHVLHNVRIMVLRWSAETMVHHCTHLYNTVHHSSASQERSVLTLQSTAAGVRSVPQSRLSTDQWQIRLVKHLPAATPDPGRPLVAGWRQKLVLRVLSRTMRCLCLGSVLLCRQFTRTTTEELRVSSAGVSHYTPLYPLYSLSRHNPVISC